MARTDGQLNLPPSLLPNSEQADAVLRNSEQPATLLRKSEQQPAVFPKSEQWTADEADDLSARLVDEAMQAAGLSNADAAFILSISESLVGKMRKPQNRERMSHAQMLRLGCACPRFYIELNVALDKRTNWFRRFALQLQQQASTFFAMAGNR